MMGVEVLPQIGLEQAISRGDLLRQPDQGSAGVAYILQRCDAGFANPFAGCDDQVRDQSIDQASQRRGLQLAL